MSSAVSAVASSDVIAAYKRQLAFRIREAAEILGISVSMTWKLIKSGEITVIRLGRTTRITADEINRLLKRDA